MQLLRDSVILNFNRSFAITIAVFKTFHGDKYLVVQVRGYVGSKDWGDRGG